MTMIEFFAKRNNVPASLRAINSAILSGVTIVVGYTTANQRYGCAAENWLHIGGRSVYWPIGYATPDDVAEEIIAHAKSMGKEAHISFCKTGQERGQIGTLWWCKGSHIDRFSVMTILPWQMPTK